MAGPSRREQPCPIRSSIALLTMELFRITFTGIDQRQACIWSADRNPISGTSEGATDGCQEDPDSRR